MLSGTYADQIKWCLMASQRHNELNEHTHHWLVINYIMQWCLINVFMTSSTLLDIDFVSSNCSATWNMMWRGRGVSTALSIQHNRPCYAITHHQRMIYFNIDIDIRVFAYHSFEMIGFQIGKSIQTLISQNMICVRLLQWIMNTIKSNRIQNA